MNTDEFLSRVDQLFVGDPSAGVPADPMMGEIHAEVAGFTSAAELAILNAAARAIPENECYLEIGSFRGRSIAAAVQGVASRTFYVVESFLEFGMEGAEARNELYRNLHEFGGGADVRLIEGDCFEVLARPGIIDQPIGVYFYDGGHSGLAHYLALGVVEPLLADDALVLIDDATWPVVADATRRYVDTYPGWEVVRRFDAETNDDPAWANGLHLLRYRRPPGTVARRSREVEAKRLVQVRVRTPAARLAYRSLRAVPALVPLAKRLVGDSGRSIPAATTDSFRSG